MPTSWTTARAPATGRSRKAVVWRQISTSIVENSNPPRINTTPNDVKVKRKTMEAGGGNGRTKERERYLAEGSPPPGAQHAGGFLQAGIEMCPQSANGSHHHRVVVKDVSDEDCPDGLAEIDPERAVGTEHGQIRGPDDHGGQHKRNRDGSPEEALAGEGEAGEDVGSRHRNNQGDNR